MNWAIPYELIGHVAPNPLVIRSLRHASGLATACTVTLNPDTVLPSDLLRIFKINISIIRVSSLSGICDLSIPSYLSPFLGWGDLFFMLALRIYDSGFLHLLFARIRSSMFNLTPISLIGFVFSISIFRVIWLMSIDLNSKRAEETFSLGVLLISESYFFCLFFIHFITIFTVRFSFSSVNSITTYFKCYM